MKRPDKALLGLFLSGLTACGGATLGTYKGEGRPESSRSPGPTESLSTDPFSPDTGAQGPSSSNQAGQYDTPSHSPSFELPALETHPEVYLSLVEVTRIEEVNLEVPVLEFSLFNADFVRIMRCQESYPFPVPPDLLYSSDSSHERQYSQLEREVANDLLIEDLKWAWGDALGSRKCQIVAHRALFGNFEDLTADRGEFYYVLNPCVLDPKNPEEEKAGLCSYRIQISQSLTTANLENESLLELRYRYSEARARVESLLTRLRSLAAEVQRSQEQCEKEVSSGQSKASFWSTVGQLASVGLTSALSSATGGLAGTLLTGSISSIVSSVFGSGGKIAADTPSCKSLQVLIEQGNSLAEDYETALVDLRLAVTELEAAQTLNASLD